MKAVVSVDQNWGIGFRNNLLFHTPEDMAFFKQLTLGGVVVMGRSTFDSLPGRRPLKGRVNIILSRSLNIDDLETDRTSAGQNRQPSQSGSIPNGLQAAPELIVCRALTELSLKLQPFNTDNVFIIGGESVYAQLLPYCSEAYVTRWECLFEADSRFPDLDREKGWKAAEVHSGMKYESIDYSRIRYTNIHVLQLPSSI